MKNTKLLKKLFESHNTLIRYFIFGVLTTIINVLVFFILFHFIGLSNVISNVIAWIVAVNFAFITNRLFVFGKNDNSLYQTSKQFFLFIISRVYSGILDIAFMLLTVDILNFNEIIMKIGSNIIVVIINYFLSKNYIFTKN